MGNQTTVQALIFSRFVSVEVSQVAFVPADGPLETRTNEALQWIAGLEDVTGRRAGLVTPLAREYGPLIEAFKRDHAFTSVKTARSVGDGPILIHCTGLDGLVKFGQSRPLVYVAWGDERWLEGWAAVLEAVDVFTRRVAAPPEDKVRELLEHLAFAGNNGWFDGPGKRDARRLLAELDPLVGRHYAVGAMLARGCSKASLEGLLKLRIAPPPPATPPSDSSR